MHVAAIEIANHPEENVPLLSLQEPFLVLERRLPILLDRNSPLKTKKNPLGSKLPKGLILYHLSFCQQIAFAQLKCGNFAG
jgi:hypothetical protein